MDGFKSRLRRSLQFRLSVYMSLIICMMAVVAVIISYLNALNEAKEIQDAGLKQMARLIKQAPLTLIEHLELNSKPSIIIQRASRPGQALALPDKLSDGLHSLTLKRKNYRVLKLTLPNNDSVIIAQPTVLVREAARSAAISTALPLLLLLPLLIIAAYLLVSHAFRPIIRLSNETLQRSAHDLTPLIITTMPDEITPLIAAINQQFNKVAQTIEAQKRFIADAAHELRTPLTALTLQSERLASAQMSDTAKARLDTLRQGIDRTSMLLEQLLSFAKTQNSPPSHEHVPVAYIVHRVLQDLLPIAEAKHINLGVSNMGIAPELAFKFKASAADLSSLIKNLVDNAIKYTPAYGQVDIAVSAGQDYLLLEVEDSGCGIADAEKQRVFDAFYRVLGHDAPGSGLGLSIVKSVVDKLGGTIELLDASRFTCGLKVKVYLPGSPVSPAISPASTPMAEL